MLTGVHFLLTFKCDLECDHCFVYGSPKAGGTFTVVQIRDALSAIARIKSVEWIYFEGGEPFLFYQVMLEGIRLARGHGFKAGVVTNGYWATSPEDAELWLRPLMELGIADLSISDDSFHYEDQVTSPAKIGLAVARRLGMPVGPICIDRPVIREGPDPSDGKGKPVIAGGAKLRGRAVEKLTAELPRRPWQDLAECPYEDLADPKRVHLDHYGNVHVCQGLSLGNMSERPLSELIETYDARVHPICGPLFAGGPAQLVKTYRLKHEEQYVDECHLCYVARHELLDRFPQYLAPKLVYGLYPP